MKKIPVRTMIGSDRGNVVRKAKARRKLDSLRHMSEDGASLEEAAEHFGTTVSRLKAFLETHENSVRWPISGCEPKDRTS